MSTVVVDFETFYDGEYSLTKMSTEDYVCDPRFEIILVGVKVDDQPPQWMTGTKKETREWLLQFNLDKVGVISHNSMFDALILQEALDIRPGLIIDTMGLAQAALKPFIPRVSLASCLQYAQVGLQKGTMAKQMFGRPRASLSKQELVEYGGYCMDDCEGEYRLFKFLKPMFARSEFEIMDMTHRMYLEPKFELDAGMLAEILHEEREKKRRLMAQIEQQGTKADLMSNDKFAELLMKFGIEPPKKISPTTGAVTWAFAKTDPGFLELEQEFVDHEMVSAIIAARKGVKTTINETRSERLLNIAMKYKLLRVPLNYYAAHTGRYGGTQKINMQNPPKVKTSRIRYAMRAPKGHVVLAADLSQIEARITAWLSTSTDLTRAFRGGVDIYSDFATKAYGIETVRDRSEADEARRFVGKTCILGLGYGMGAEKLKNTLFKDGVRVSMEESRRLVTTYRCTYPNIPLFWRKLDSALAAIAMGITIRIGPCTVRKNCVILPNGMPLVYHNLHSVNGEWTYNFGYEVRHIWGGKLLENIVQALARIVVMDHMITIKKQLNLAPVLQVHDELDYIVRQEEAKDLGRQITGIMSTPPAWAESLPVAVEINSGPSFGDC